MDRHLVAVEVLDEGADAALELEHVLPAVPLVHQVDTNALIQERQLPQPLGQDVVVELDVGEDLGAGLEANHGAALLGFTRNGQGRLGLAESVALLVDACRPG